MSPARGEVWWADIPGADDPHPLLVLTRDAAIAVRDRVTVAPISSTRRGIPVEVEVDERDDLDHTCVVDLDNLFTIPKSLLVDRMCRLSEDRMLEIREAIMVALDL